MPPILIITIATLGGALLGLAARHNLATLGYRHDDELGLRQPGPRWWAVWASALALGSITTAATASNTPGRTCPCFPRCRRPVAGSSRLGSAPHPKPSAGARRCWQRFSCRRHSSSIANLEVARRFPDRCPCNRWDTRHGPLRHQGRNRVRRRQARLRCQTRAGIARSRPGLARCPRRFGHRRDLVQVTPPPGIIDTSWTVASWRRSSCSCRRSGTTPVTWWRSLSDRYPSLPRKPMTAALRGPALRGLLSVGRPPYSSSMVRDDRGLELSQPRLPRTRNSWIGGVRRKLAPPTQEDGGFADFFDMIGHVTAGRRSEGAENTGDPYSLDRVGGGPVAVNTRQAWIAADYVGLLASQAGYAWRCVRPDGDVHSLDGDVVVHPGGSVFVQVKGHRPHFPRSTSYPIQQAWRRNWKSLMTPAYFVVVTVPDDMVADWVDHREADRDTLLHLSAYWARIDPLADSTKSVGVSRSSRLTIDTFESWRKDYIASTRVGFGMVSALRPDSGEGRDHG